MEKLRAIVKRPDEEFGHMTNVSVSLKNLQNLVGGYIETVTLGPINPDLVVVCNEEGRLMGLDYNCTVAGIDFVGDIVVLGMDGDKFSDIPISFADWKELIWEGE
ncbi:MAG: DUF3846 domain-containing protein [Mogibacterium sp.]|nr:DUF3846 domain-containing protein [Mogibacterium sp.]